MKFDCHDLEMAYYCATEVLNLRRLRGQPIPAGLRSYYEELEADWAEMSGSGPKTCAAGVASQTLGVKEVAEMLSITTRHVRRRARTDPSSLGAQRVNGTWIFNRAAVENYARTRKTSA